MEFLRDPIWQFVGAVLALAGIGITLFVRQKRLKELSAGFIVKKSLISVAPTVSDRIEIQLDGEKIQNLKIYSYGFKNSGNVEILPSDFEKSVSLKIGEGAKIIEHSVSSRNPQSLAPTINSDSTTLSVQPLLLNPGDFFVVDVLATGSSSTLVLDCRIAGIPDVKKINSGVRYTPDRTANLIYNLVLSGVMGAVIYFAAKFFGDSNLNLILLSFGVFASMLALMNIVQYAVGKIMNTSNRYI